MEEMIEENTVPSQENLPHNKRSDVLGWNEQLYTQLAIWILYT